MKKNHKTPFQKFLRSAVVTFSQAFTNIEYFYFWLLGTLIGIAWLSIASPYGWMLLSFFNFIVAVSAVASVVGPVDKAFESLSLDFTQGYGRPYWIVKGKYPAAQDIIQINAAGYSKNDFERFSDQISSRLSQPIREIRKPSAKSSVIEIVLKRSEIKSALKFEELPLSSLKGGEFFVGQSDDGLEKLAVADMIHMLVAGQTGMGKTQFIRQVLATILYQTRDAHICLIDMKGGVDYQPFHGIPNFEMVTSYDEADTMLDDLIKLFEIRRDILNEKKKSNWNDLTHKELEKNPSIQGKPLGTVILAVDELAELSKKATQASAKSELQEKIATLARLSRFTGIHLVLGTQRPSKDVIAMQSKDNLPTRVCFSVPSVAASTLVVGDMSASNLGNHRGRAVYQSQSTKIIQAPFARNEEIEKLMAVVSERLKRTGYHSSIQNRSRERRIVSDKQEVNFS